MGHTYLKLQKQNITLCYHQALQGKLFLQKRSWMFDWVLKTPTMYYIHTDIAPKSSTFHVNNSPNYFIQKMLTW